MRKMEEKRPSKGHTDLESTVIIDFNHNRWCLKILVPSITSRWIKWQLTSKNNWKTTNGLQTSMMSWILLGSHAFFQQRNKSLLHWRYCGDPGHSLSQQSFTLVRVKNAMDYLILDDDIIRTPSSRMEGIALYWMILSVAYLMKTRSRQPIKKAINRSHFINCQEISALLLYGIEHWAQISLK